MIYCQIHLTVNEHSSFILWGIGMECELTSPQLSTKTTYFILCEVIKVPLILFYLLSIRDA